MSLFEALKSECIEFNQDISGKDDTLKRIASTAAAQKELESLSEDEIYRSLKAREDQGGTTGFGNGIAIPHCALEHAKDFVVGIIINKKGVDFGSLDKKPVYLFAYIIGPASQRKEHIHLLSAVSRVLYEQENIKEITSSGSISAVRENFLRHISIDLDSLDKTEKSIVNVFLQKEEWFEEILMELSEIEGINISISSSENASKYLYRQPVFSGFLGDDDKGFHKHFTIIVYKSLVNETIRRIASVAGDLNKNEGILVTSNDLDFAMGEISL